MNTSYLLLPSGAASVQNYLECQQCELLCTQLLLICCLQYLIINVWQGVLGFHQVGQFKTQSWRKCICISFYLPPSQSCPSVTLTIFLLLFLPASLSLCLCPDSSLSSAWCPVSLPLLFFIRPVSLLNSVVF